MGFKPISETSFFNKGLEYNSKLSANFKTMYENIVYEKYKQSEESKPSQTFAPSSFRCNRLSFFRLRGIDPDPVTSIDVPLEFSAMIGTACHREIQHNLKYNIGKQWIAVPEYLQVHKISHEYSINNCSEFETQLEFFNPPVKFSCDGLIQIGDCIYLLEIKTCDSNSFKNLSGPKPQHIDQIKCYCSLLEINDAIVLYQDRVYGNIKCFEIKVSQSEMDEIFKRMEYVLDCVKSNIAPPGLDKSDYWCTYCKYKNRCKQWG